MNESEITPELRNLLINFVGQTYGEMHKLDKDIVQTATNLQPASDILKARVPNIINSFTPTRQQPQSQQPQFTGAPYPQFAQPQGSFEYMQTPNTAIPQVDPNQLEFSFKASGVGEEILKVLKNIDSKLDVIVDKLS
jgi:hypothetical protein